ncbi:MAG: hypothetical protein ACREUI_06905, partial [Burkholderiales bacterium]
FVLCDGRDYLWAVEQLRKRNLSAICPVLFSPVYRQLAEQTLADWILRDRLPVRMQIQLHKLLWGEIAGR